MSMYDFYSEFQLVFCATVCAIVVGGACERGRLLPIIPFIFVRLLLPTPQISTENKYPVVVNLRLRPTGSYG